MANTIVWCDIPVTDLARASAFYSAVLNAKLEPIPGMEGAVLPHKGEEVGGCLVRKAWRRTPRPTAWCELIYLNCQGPSGRCDIAGGETWWPGAPGEASHRTVRLSRRPARL